MLSLFAANDIIQEEDIAKFVRTLPQTMDQLNELGVMGSSDLIRYGERLLYDMKSFIHEHGLECYIPISKWKI